VLRLQLEGGLRIHEALTLRSDKVNLREGSVEVKGKGGRVRKVTLLDSSVLRELPLDRNFVFPPTPAFRRAVQAEVARACEELGIACRGTHGFRATYAERYLEKRTTEGSREREARKSLARQLGHNRTDVTRKYVP
jgi:integrase